MRLLSHAVGLFAACMALAASGCSDRTTPVAGRIAVSGGASLYYEEQGTGEALILLHGHSLDGRMWDPQFAPFARRYRTIRPDFRGYGRSSAQSETHPFTHADDILTLMDSLRIGRAHVVGLSMGAFVAGELVALHPERLSSCVMASGGIRRTPGPHTPPDSLEWAAREQAIAAVQAQGIETMKRAWLEQLIAEGGSRREMLREPLARMIGDWDGWQALHHEVHLFWGLEAWEALEATRPEVPVLLLRGDAGRDGSPFRPRELDYLPRGEARLIPDCGHMLNMEQPECFNRMVLDFLAAHPQEP